MQSLCKRASTVNFCSLFIPLAIGPGSGSVVKKKQRENIRNRSGMKKRDLSQKRHNIMAIVTMEDEQELVCDLSNGVISDVLE